MAAFTSSRLVCTDLGLESTVATQVPHASRVLTSSGLTLWRALGVGRHHLDVLMINAEALHLRYWFSEMSPQLVRGHQSRKVSIDEHLSLDGTLGNRPVHMKAFLLLLRQGDNYENGANRVGVFVNCSERHCCLLGFSFSMGSLL